MGIELQGAEYWELMEKYGSLGTDPIKVNSFAQPHFQTDNFAQRTGPKMP